MSDLDTIFNDDVPANHRSGIVAVVGRPNAGKSTLINAILGQKIAIVSPKPQTTRRQQLGIYTRPDVQILFVDTPGLHKAQHKLGEYMVEMAERALQDADYVLWVLDVSDEPHTGDRYIAEKLATIRTPIILVLNKIDATDATDFPEHLSLVEHIAALPTSALEGRGIDELLTDIIERLPLGPRYYPAEQVSEVNMRFIAAEIIREKIMLHTEKEVPHAVAVAVDEYKEREDGTHYINATIYVERDSQRGIIIGKDGAMIKRIGTEARRELVQMLDARVYVELHVRVLKNWRSNETLMQRLGYRVPRDDSR